VKWTVPKLWDGETVAILASGPSLTADTAIRIRERKIPAIAINTSFLRAPWAAMLYAADAAWWTAYRNKVADFRGLKVTVRVEPFDDLLALEVSGHLGFDPAPGKIRTGANSGYQAVHVALAAGAKRIELHGFDMRHHDGLHHWHGTHPMPLRNHGGSIYERWVKSFESLVPEAAKLGAEVVNCTPDSALKCFPFETVTA
jgi:hypothetical protein